MYDLVLYKLDPKIGAKNQNTLVAAAYLVSHLME